MTFTETLFGGLLAVVVLYFLGRRFKLSNYWSASMAGIVPVVVYSTYSLSKGVSGDVFAIHLAVFIATTGVLGVFGGMQKKEEHLHWAPRMLVAFFLTLVLVMASFLSIAISGIPPWLAQWVMPHSAQHMHTGFSGATSGKEQSGD